MTVAAEQPRRRGARIASLLLLVGLGAAVVVAVRAGQGDPPAVPPPSGSATARESSCVYPSNSIARLDAFSDLVGAPISCVLVFNDVATSWDALVQPWFTVGEIADHRWDRWVQGDDDRRLVIGQSLIPAGAPPDWRQRGAAGEYDAQFAILGRRLVAAGLGRSVIRLAHEGNGDWFAHDIGDSDAQNRDWARYWARVADVLHDTPGSDFTLDLTVSAGTRAIPLDQWWPGDDAVDVIGVDQHDIAPTAIGTDQPARWTWQMTQPGGFETIAAFAAEHGKPLSIPEWGVKDASEFGAGDDTYYVARMLQLFTDNDIVYQGFWDKKDTSSELARNPGSLELYRRWISGG